MARSTSVIVSATQDVGLRSAPSVILTVSQALRYFAASLPRPGNYPRLVRPYLLFCLENSFPVDLYSVKLFGAGKPLNRVSPVRKFLRWHATQGSCRLVADPPPSEQGIPAANELILGFMNESTTLRGDESKATYTKSLNAFFYYVAQQRAIGEEASFCALTVSRYMGQLRKEGLSAFTINLRLSAIKQLAVWVIKHRNHPTINLTSEQVEALRDVDGLRGLTTERKFYKDSLAHPERDALQATITNAAHKAIVSLLVIEGLRTVEVTRLKIGDVEFEQGKLQVLGKGKQTKKDIVLFPACEDVLRDYLKSRGKWPVSYYQSEFLFPDLKTHQIRYLVDKYLGEAGLKRARISAHSLRHTAGQLLIQDGVEPVHVQRHLRHELFETTLFYIKKQTEQDYFVKIQANQAAQSTQ